MDTKALRQKILDLAIRGKLVPQDPNDEPASVLLERIREQKKQMVKEGKLKAKDIKNDSVIFVGEDSLHYEKFSDGSVKCIEEEIPFELPEGWAWCRICSIANFLGGYAYKSNKYISESKNMIIRIGNVKNNKLNPYIAQTCISDEYAIETQGYKICVGDILFTMTGTKGKRDYFFSCLIKDDDIKGTNLFLNQRVGCLRLVDNTKIIAEYLVSVLQTTDILDAIFATETGNVNQGNIGSVATLNLLVPIPPTNEQTKISKKLNKILIYLNKHDVESEELAEIIQNVKAKILNLAIRGQLVPQDSNDEPASALLERIRVEKEELIKAGKIKRDKKESIIFRSEDNSYYEKISNKTENIDSLIPFEIPDNWCFVRLKEIWELISGRDLSPAEYNDDCDGIPYITGASNFKKGKVELVRWTPAPQVITQKGDLLLTCKGTIGEIAFNDFGDAHIARQIMALRNIYDLNSEYLSLCIRFYIESIKAAAKGLIPGISREDILNIILPIPPINYQQLVVLKIEKLNHILNSIEKSLS